MVFCTHHAIVGRSDAAVQERRERVQTAVKNAGLHFPRHRIVVNAAPASVRKDGPSYDLPIALGVIILGGYLPQEAVEGTLAVGELSLDGMLRHARGVPPMATTARAEGYRRMFVAGGGGGRVAFASGAGTQHCIAPQAANLRVYARRW